MSDHPGTGIVGPIKKTNAVTGVRGGYPLQQEQPQIFTWRMELGAKRNYRSLGKRLAKRNKGSLFRNADGHGLIHVAPNATCLVAKGSQLAPLIVDSLTMQVIK